MQPRPKTEPHTATARMDAVRAALTRLAERLFAPVDVASLVVFRVMFGLIMVWEVLRYVDGDRIYRYYIEPTFQFKYSGFGWVDPWPGNGMYWHFALLGVLGAFIAAGFLYRLSAAIFFVAFTYVFLLDETRYLNHFYLVSIVSFLMIFVPAHRAGSVDAWLRPRLRSTSVPAWPLWLLRAQLGIVYVYAGIAKINHDWLRGQPLGMWLGKRSDDPLLGWMFTSELGIYMFSYGGLLLDLMIVPLLLWRRTRLPALAAVFAFHLLNARIFSIGIFPWFMMAATLLFLSPDWPRRLGGRKDPRGLFPLRKKSPGVFSSPGDRPLCRQPAKGSVPMNVTIALLGLYLAVQLLVPLRHWLYPGVVHWTEEGHRFSWHMKLRDKSARTLFFATDPSTGEQWQINQSAYLTPKQQSKMARRPYMIHQFALHLAEELRGQGYEQIEIRVDARASLNGRPGQFLIDHRVDLAKERDSLWAKSWIVPLE